MTVACALPAAAQSPWPQVRITGIVDSVVTGGGNAFDDNYATTHDSGWLERNRMRLRVTHEVESLRLKNVLELQADLRWHDVSGVDGPSRDVFRNDSTEALRLRQGFAEFPLPRSAWMPYSTLRLGLQPFDATLKPAVLLTDDVTGLWLQSELTDRVTLGLTYAVLESDHRTNGNRRIRGDDWLALASLTFDLAYERTGTRARWRPLWGYFVAGDTAATATRCAVSCAGLPSNARDAGYFPFGSTERRHYVGLDAELSWEAEFHFEPTVLFMTSVAETAGDASSLAAACGEGQPCRAPPGARRQETRSQSWLLDLRGGWRCRSLRVNCEALHVEGQFMWTPGDASHHNLFRKNRVFHPVAVDGNYLGGWNEILAFGSVDYLTGNAHGMGDNVGLGRYGRIQIGSRVSYLLWRTGYDEATISFRWASAWTDQAVDTDAGSVAGSRHGAYGNVPCALAESNCREGNNRRGDARYIGTETALRFNYRLTAGLSFDVVAAWLAAGAALDSPSGSARDAQLVAGRVRFQF